MLVQIRQKRKHLRVGSLAKATGKTVRALHHYEELGLLAPSYRSKGGYRLYGEDAAIRVSWISKLQEMGFSLTQIQELLRRWEHSGSAPSAMLGLADIYQEKLDETRAQICKLRALEDELVRSLRYLETCDTCDPQRLIASCPVCETPHNQQSPPDLIAGFHTH